MSGSLAGQSNANGTRSEAEHVEHFLADLVGRVERDYFAQLLARYKGNVARCAKHSGLSRRSVTQKLQKYALDRTRFKDSSTLADAAGP